MAGFWLLASLLRLIWVSRASKLWIRKMRDRLRALKLKEDDQALIVDECILRFMQIEYFSHFCSMFGMFQAVSGEK